MGPDPSPLGAAGPPRSRAVAQRSAPGGARRRSSVVELLYSLAAALFTPQTDFDALSYHLVRAVLWIQQSSISPIGGMTDTRIDEFPPNAEILQGFTMLTSHSVRFVGLVQFTALLVTIAAIYGIGRRLGLRDSLAAFGALLYPTLPVIALQAPSALNDIVVAAFIALAVYFALGRTNGDAVNLVVAAGLLAGVKVTSILALPLILGVPALVHRGRRRLVLLGGVGAAWLAGSWWYAFNVSAGSGVLGEDGSSAGATDGPLTDRRPAQPHRDPDARAAGRRVAVTAICTSSGRARSSLRLRRSASASGVADSWLPRRWPCSHSPCSRSRAFSGRRTSGSSTLSASRRSPVSTSCATRQPPRRSGRGTGLSGSRSRS